MATSQVRTTRVWLSTLATIPVITRPNMIKLSRTTVARSCGMIPSSTILPTRYGPTEPGSHSSTLINELSNSTGSCCHSNHTRNRIALRVSGWVKSRLGKRRRTTARRLRVGVVYTRTSGPAKSGTSGGKSCMTNSG